MAKFNNTRSASGELSTIIGADAALNGRLETKASLRVDGKVTGELISSEVVTIGQGGIVEGDVAARDIVVGGKIMGKLNATGKVVLESTAALTGDLKTARLVVEEGATFNGNSNMGNDKPQPPQQQHQPRKIQLDEA